MRSLLGLILVLGLMAAGTGWLFYSLEARLAAQNQDSDAPQLVMGRFTATLINAQGIREQTLSAPKLTQMPADGGSWLEAPRLAIYSPDQQLLWRLNADRGWVSTDSSRLLLTEDVEAFRLPVAGAAALTLRTRDVTVYPDGQRAETDAPATLTTPGGELTGIGVRADMIAGTIRLLSTVRGRYAPP